MEFIHYEQKIISAKVLIGTGLKVRKKKGDGLIRRYTSGILDNRNEVGMIKGFQNILTQLAM